MSSREPQTMRKLSVVNSAVLGEHVQALNFRKELESKLLYPTDKNPVNLNPYRRTG